MEAAVEQISDDQYLFDIRKVFHAAYDQDIQVIVPQEEVENGGSTELT